ncbi:MAG: tetratricopeptide repeat protein, partial [Bacteroidota bacterium]
MPRTIQLFVVCLMLCCLGISNQSRATEPPGEVDSVLYQSSLRFFRKGITAYRQKQYDSTAHYLKLATDGYLKANAVDAYLDGLLNLTTILHLDRQYASYFQYAQKTRREIHQRIGRKNVRYAKALNNLMSHYHRRGNNRFAITLLEEALVILNSIDAPQALFLQNYKNQATAYKRIGDYTRAVRFCEKSLELLLKDSVNTVVRDLAHAHNDIADICQSAGRFDQALEQYGESLRLLKDINVKDEPIAVKRKIRALHGFSRISIEKGELQKAKVYLVRAIALQKGDITYRLSFSYELQGRIWMAQGRADEALKAYQKSLALAQKYIVSLLPYDHARKKFWIAQAYQALGQRTQALEICQKTLSILSPSFQSESLKDNPSPDKFLSEVLAIDLLRLKGQLLKEAYEQKGDLHWLHAAKNAYETALNVIRQLRKSVKTAQSKTELSERTTAVYEEAIDIVFQLYHDTKEVHYKELAFAYAESNKALLLLENINEQLARGLKGLPDSLVERDKQLRLDIAFYEKKVLDVTGSPSAKDSSKIANWKGQLFDLRQAQERLTKIFELKYPHFYKLKYQQEQIDLSVIRQQLAERQQALIEYFFGDEKIYIFLLTETQMEVFSVAYSSKLNEQIEQLRQAVSSFPSDQELASNFEQYTKTAFALYEQLLAPALKQLPTSVSSLILIPDYQLNH